jgi:hypothetical protein
MPSPLLEFLDQAKMVESCLLFKILTVSIHSKTPFELDAQNGNLMLLRHHYPHWMCIRNGYQLLLYL